jgi:C-terminal processing protease CtpA/Prc
MRHLLIIFLLAITSNCSSLKQKVLTPKKYLNEVLEIVEKKSINIDSVDFKTIKYNALSKLSNTNTIQECYPIIRSILRDLGDNHSFLMSKGQVKNWKSTSKYSDETKLFTFSGKLLNDNYGYIKMDGFNSGDSFLVQKYADSLQNKIKSIDNKNIKGWVLDLRENTGGNCWPMLTGIGPILGNGICGYFVDRKGKKSSWFYKNGKSGINKSTITKVSHQPYKVYDNTKPIAVLTGSRTGSSGEVVVAAFHNKENTRSFGTKTYGVSTGNQNFNLSDGSMLILTTSIYADRKGRVFGTEIEPDETVEFKYNSIGKKSDLVIQKAIEWINEKNKTLHNKV